MSIRKNEFKMLAIIKISDGFLSVFWNCVGRVFLYFFITKYLAVKGNKLEDANVFTLITIFETITYYC